MTVNYLDDDVPFPGASAVQFTVFFHHDDLSFLLHLLHVLLHLVQNAAIVLLCYTDKLDRRNAALEWRVATPQRPNTTVKSKRSVKRERDFDVTRMVPNTYYLVHIQK